MPTWRADYFDNPRDNAPSRSEIIVAENESDALHALAHGLQVVPLPYAAHAGG
jgi:hypothetical protein